jgi:hypothetical protein
MSDRVINLMDALEKSLRHAKPEKPGEAPEGDLTGA